MREEEFKEILRFFARARDRFLAQGKAAEGQQCEDAIATAHLIVNDPRFPFTD
jgi:hypothetical protein